MREPTLLRFCGPISSENRASPAPNRHSASVKSLWRRAHRDRVVRMPVPILEGAIIQLHRHTEPSQLHLIHARRLADVAIDDDAHTRGTVRAAVPATGDPCHETPYAARAATTSSRLCSAGITELFRTNPNRQSARQREL